MLARKAIERVSRVRVISDSHSPTCFISSRFLGAIPLFSLLLPQEVSVFLTPLWAGRGLHEDKVMEKVVVFPKSKTILAFDEKEMGGIFTDNVKKMDPIVIDRMGDRAEVKLGEGLASVIAKCYGPVTMIGEVSAKSGIKITKIIYKLIKGEFDHADKPIVIDPSQGELF